MNLLRHERETSAKGMTAELRNALLIHNPNAGNGGRGRRRTLDAARRIFALGGIEAELAETTAPGDATLIARRAAAEGCQLVIACGGDGTLNEIVNGLAAQKNGRRVPLALLLGGTANVLAKEMHLPWDIPIAAERLVHGEVKEIALGLASPLGQPEKKKFFLSVAGAGPDGMIVYSLDLDLKARLGILAYWWKVPAKSSVTSSRTFALSLAARKLTPPWLSSAAPQTTAGHSRSPPARTSSKINSRSWPSRRKADFAI